MSGRQVYILVCKVNEIMAKVEPKTEKGRDPKLLHPSFIKNQDQIFLFRLSIKCHGYGDRL